MSDPIVITAEGTLKGVIGNLKDGTSYFSFKGIPYAKTPVGEHRFKAPLPVKSWTGILEVTEHGCVCPQMDMTTGSLMDNSEECLFLNVYTKSLNPSSNIPVMVFVHGGGYMSGSGNSDMYGPEYLLQHNIVLVTINYRLEVLGFLCLDTPEVPGNAGMKDQVAALHWLQRNIRNFGGNPLNVTIFGQSAGSASVTYHMLSPMSKGLFHKAIALSGTSLCEWAEGKNPVERAFRLGKLLGKETVNKHELLEFLRSVPPRDLVKVNIKTRTTDEKYRELPVHFAPVVEKRFNGVDAFLDDHPINLIMENKFHKVPLMIGYTSQEGIMVLPIMLKHLDTINKNPGYLVPREIRDKTPAEKLEELGKMIKKFYFGNKSILRENTAQMDTYATDAFFVYNIHRFVYLTANFCKQIYMYRFDCDTELNLTKKLFGFEHIAGACHADDLFYMFSMNVTNELIEKRDDLKEIISTFTKLLTNFARTGNPTPDNSLGCKWDLYTKNRKEFLNIGEKFTAGQYAERERVEFWNKIYKDAGLPCITNSNL